MNAARIDPILASIINRRLQAITEEMGLSLLMSSRSPIMFGARDFCTGLYGPKGEMWAQAEYIPAMAMAIQPSLFYLLEYYGDEIYPGDAIIANDPYCGGNHLNDVSMYRPIFFKDALVGWSATKAHQADLGSCIQGNYNPLAKDIWSEALRLPPVKVYEKGCFRRDVWDMIFANSRLPFVVGGDMKAQIGGCVVGERAILALVERYGLGRLRAHIDYILNSTEQQMRNEIRKYPDGNYEGEDFIEFDGLNIGKRYRIKVTVTVEDDEITFDFNGTDEQSPTYCNSSATSTKSSVLTGLLTLVDPYISHNEGVLRPVTIKIPEGSILNPKYPSAVAFGNHMADQICMTMYKALHKAIPDKVTAGWNFMNSFMYGGWDPRKKKQFFDLGWMELKGGGGAPFGVDGYDHVGSIVCLGGVMAHDPEIRESVNPDLITKYEYEQDSAGAGEWRGGLGSRTISKMEGEKVMASFFGEGFEKGPFGLFGGKGSQPNSVSITYPDGRTYCPGSKEVVYNLDGCILDSFISGGGGFGDPHRRPVEKVKEEVRDEIISIKMAKEDYGVVIDPDTFEVDYEKTEKIRSSRPLVEYPQELKKY